MSAPTVQAKPARGILNQLVLQTLQISPAIANNLSTELNTDTCMLLAANSFSNTQIAELYGVTHQAITNRLQKLGVTRKTNTAEIISVKLQLEEFKKNPSDVYADVERRALEKITDKKLDDCSGPQLIVIAGTARDKQQVISGKSGQVNQLTVIIQQAYSSVVKTKPESVD